LVTDAGGLRVVVRQLLAEPFRQLAIPVADRGHRRIRIDLHGGIVTGLPFTASETPGRARLSRMKRPHDTSGVSREKRSP
jgi:hypothetical protein